MIAFEESLGLTKEVRCSQLPLIDISTEAGIAR